MERLTGVGPDGSMTWSRVVSPGRPAVLTSAHPHGSNATITHAARASPIVKTSTSNTVIALTPARNDLGGQATASGPKVRAARASRPRKKI